MMTGKTKTSRRYKKPPLVEAVCEFRLTEKTPWDLTVPGILYEKLAKEFPHKADLPSEPAVLVSRKGLQVKQVQESDFIRLSDEAKCVHVNIAQRSVAVASVKKYPGWARYKPRILTVLNSLVASVEIPSFGRLGLRYVNRILIPSDKVELEDYFEMRPHTGPGLPQDMGSFIAGCVFVFENMRDACRVQLTDSSIDKEGVSGFTLDIDYFLAEPGSVGSDGAEEWIDTAHKHVCELFEGCVTDASRALFEEDH